MKFVFGSLFYQLIVIILPFFHTGDADSCKYKQLAMEKVLSVSLNDEESNGLGQAANEDAQSGMELHFPYSHKLSDNFL